MNGKQRMLICLRDSDLDLCFGSVFLDAESSVVVVIGT
jgi:hypothetical protein